MKVTVTVRPRAGILDPQGEALRRSLQIERDQPKILEMVSRYK